MTNPKMDDDSAIIQLSTSQNANAPICSVKLDGPKTYLIWSRQCTVALKLGGYLDMLLGRRNNLRMKIQPMISGTSRIHWQCLYYSTPWIQAWWDPTSSTIQLHKS